MKVGVMGCGGSRATRLVSPLSKAVITWNSTSQQPTALQIKERLRFMSTRDASVQVGTAPSLADKTIQTDAVHFTEEDLETLLEDDAEEPEITDNETQTNMASNPIGGDNVKSVLMQTDNEKTGSVKYFHKRQLVDTQEFNIITIDIGVQAVKPLSDHCTQTYRISLMEFESAGWRLDYTSKSGKKLGIVANKRLSKMADFESQTDPVTRALAANAAGIEPNVFSQMDSISPIAHIHKELGNTGFKSSQVSKSAIHESIARLLEDVEDSMRSDSEIDGRFLGYNEPLVVKCDAGIQTDNDPITDEAPEFAARPPPCKKKEMIPCMSIFKENDKRALDVPEAALINIRSLVKYLTAECENDIHKVRAFFRWIADNIVYDWRYMDIKLSAEEVFQRREGVCKDYCKLFSEMCRLSGIRVKTLNGFAKGYDYRPGHQFVPGEDVTHAWNAVFIYGAWRFIDTTWGTGFTDHTGKFQQKLNEHFFLTDPDTMIWTHYPYDEMENNYSRWQLLDVTVSLEEFNALPKVTPYFFDYNMKIRSRPQNPVVFKVHKEVKIAAHEPMRWKYKLYAADEIENASLNNYVFCQLKEDRLVGSFAVTPPVEGRYYFKVYAKPEHEMKEETNLHNVVIFLLDCLVAKKYIQPYPHNEVPWGPTQCFYDYKMKMINQSGPMIVTWGGKRKLILEVKDVMLITYQLLDVEGIEMDPKDTVRREDKENRVNFTFTPQRVEENEVCDAHLMGSLRDIKAPRCKDGLKCINGKCSQDGNVKGPCLLLRKSMEEKRTEEDFADDLWHPECDENGGFKAKQIKKRKAICYNRQGEKIYGQEEPEFAKNMTCGCSRRLDNLRKENPISFNTVPQEHCTETGDFERMQCIGDLCFCANPVTGKVNSRVVKTAYFSRLPCYDKKLHGKGFLKECEKELQRTRYLRFYFFQKGLEIFGLETLRCDFDGTFAARQCDSTECRCTDERGISIKSYYIGLKDYENLQREMTCDCARDIEIVASHRQYAALKCESFGNYRRLQCFEDDQCFCVDEDGDIISRLWNKTELQDEHCDDILKYLYLIS